MLDFNHHRRSGAFIVTQLALAVAFSCGAAPRARAADSTSKPAETAALDAVSAADEVAASPGSDADAGGADGGDSGLQSVVVTSRKREERLQDVPLAITVIGSDALQSSDEIKTANDITQFIPNASASATNGRTRPRWFLRGIGTNETQASTTSPIGIYNDDVYLNNVYIQGFPLFDTERVEVLRGPQGTLWGKNTTGGAISYVSRKPTFDSNGYADVSFGRFNERNIEAAAGTGLTDTLAGRISVFDERRDGWVDNLATNRKDGAVSDFAVRGQLLYEPTSDLEILLNLHERRLNGDKSPSFYVLDPTVPLLNPLYAGPLTGRASISQSGEAGEDLDSDGADLRADWNIGAGYSLTSITAYEAGDYVQPTGSPVTPDVSRQRDAANSKQYSQELRLASPKDDRLNWILGAYYFQEGLTSDSVLRKDRVANASTTSPTGFSPFGFTITDYDQQTTSLAGFANVTWKWTDQWSITGGVRYSKESKDYDLSYQAAPASATFTGITQWWLPTGVSSLLPASLSSASKSWDQVTYDVTPQLRLNDDVNAYFRFSHGFRAGGFVVSPTNTITTLDPETLDAYELGLKTQWLESKLTANLALFNYNYKDIIVGVLLPVPGTNTTLQVQENAAKGYSRGAELELSYNLLPNLHVGGSLGYLSTKYTSYSSTASGQAIDATGNAFTRAPKYSQTVDAEYRYPLTNGASVSLRTDWSYRSRQYFNAVNQTDPTLWQSGYALGNARVGYLSANGRIETALYVDNLTDKVYSALATGPSAGTTREVYGLPRTYGATFYFKY
jgi:iron complex outermembrane recepter protein